MNYIRETFNPIHLKHAKDIVLSPDGKDPDKFEADTQFFINFILQQHILTANSLVLDFVCGM